MANENCLRGMQCPECGSAEPFRIAVITTAVFWDDGSDAQMLEGDLEWEDESYCKCMTCDYEAQVKDFQQTPDKEEAIDCSECNADIDLQHDEWTCYNGLYVCQACEEEAEERNRASEKETL